MRSTAKPGTVCGMPASSATSRPSVRPWSPTWAVAAKTTSPMRSGGRPGFRRSSSRTTLTAMSSARVRQKMPFEPARPNTVRTPSTKTTSRSSLPTAMEHTQAVEDWTAIVEREVERYREGEARLGGIEDADARQRQLTRMGNAAGGAGLALLMQGRAEEARELARPRGRALPRELGRRRRPGAGAVRSERSRRACSPATGRRSRARMRAGRSKSGAAEAESPIGRYAACLARSSCWRDRARRVSSRTTSARTTASRLTVGDALAFDRGRRTRSATRGDRVGARVVRDARRLPRGRSRGRHGARVAGTRCAARSGGRARLGAAPGLAVVPAPGGMREERDDQERPRSRPRAPRPGRPGCARARGPYRARAGRSSARCGTAPPSHGGSQPCWTSSSIAALASLAAPLVISSGATRIRAATARYGFSRRLVPAASSIRPAFRSMRTWKCRCPGSTPSLPASSRFVS